jgi:hypothetical protein
MRTDLNMKKIHDMELKCYSNPFAVGNTTLMILSNTLLKCPLYSYGLNCVTLQMLIPSYLGNISQHSTEFSCVSQSLKPNDLELNISS